MLMEKTGQPQLRRGDPSGRNSSRETARSFAIMPV
jgi:hypothetical protein